MREMTSRMLDPERQKVPGRISVLVPFVVFVIVAAPVFAENDTYQEGFEARQSNATISGVDSWAFSQGDPSSAIVQDGVSISGGKSLQIKSSENSVKLARSNPYGNISPAWVEYQVRPGMGGELNEVPLGGIGAVVFNYDGQIYAADGSQWIALGQSFDPETWYRVVLKIDFSSKKYAVYISKADTYKSPFDPDKDHLNFIDPSINKLSELGFQGVHKSSGPKDSYIDGLRVHFVDKIQIISPPQDVVKGRPSDAIWIQLQNSVSEPQPAFEDLVFELNTTSSKGSFSLDAINWDPIHQVVMPEGIQTVQVFYRDDQQGKPLLTVDEYPDRGWKQGTQTVNVLSAGNSFTLSMISPQIAGQDFALTITARDETGEIDPTYEGTLKLSVDYLDPPMGTKVLSLDAAGGFVNGSAEVMINYPDCGKIEIKAVEENDPDKSGGTGPVDFVPKEFTVDASAVQMVSKKFPVTITAVNAQGASTPNYTGEAILSVQGVNPMDTSGGALSAGSVAGNQWLKGSATVDLAYNRWGSIQIKAADSRSASYFGTSGVIAFEPKTISVTAAPPSDGRLYYYVGEAIQLTFQVLDATGAPIRNFEGAIGLKSNQSLDLPQTISFTAADQGAKTIPTAASASGDFQVVITLTGTSLEAKSAALPVRDAIVQVVSTSAPVGSTEVEIELVDEKGQRIRDSRVPITITLVEENANGSAMSSATSQQVTFVNGVAKIEVTNLEPETVTIIPKSLLGFKIRSGIVQFGRVGKSGIGALMWWEVKDEKEKRFDKVKADRWDGLETEDEDEEKDQFEKVEFLGISKHPSESKANEKE